MICQVPPQTPKRAAGEQLGHRNQSLTIACNFLFLLDPSSNLIERFPAAIALILEQSQDPALTSFIAVADTMATESIDCASREIAEFHCTTQRLQRTQVSREHERDGLGGHAELLPDLPERIAEAAQHGDLADALGYGG